MTDSPVTPPGASATVAEKLAALTAMAQERTRLEAMERDLVCDLRRDRTPWEAIGEAAGLSKQGAHARWHRAVTVRSSILAQAVAAQGGPRGREPGDLVPPAAAMMDRGPRR